MLRILASLFAVFIASAVGISIYYLSGALIFAGRVSWDFNRPKEASCTFWQTDYLYANRRGMQGPIAIPSCEQALDYKRTSHFVENKNGLKIHTLSFDRQEALALETPIWLHVHGITENWLHGARYLESSERLGFRLVIVEPQNHGQSDRHSGGSSWGCEEKYDLAAVLEDISQRYPKAPILITASSMGTAITTHTALAFPELFSNVKALVYESAVSSPIFVLKMWKIGDGHSESFSQNLYDTLIMTSKLRTDVDLDGCFQSFVKNPKTVDIPTLIQLSLEEHPKKEIRELFKSYPHHTNIRTVEYPQGIHAAFWNYQPEQFEEDIKNLWQEVYEEKEGQKPPIDQL